MKKNIDIQFCKKCLYSNLHPLGLLINQDGICSGCIIHEEKNKLDWNYKWKILEKKIKKYYKKNSEYDCIIPVTGAQDSYFIVDIVKNKLNLKPLLVSYNKYFNTEIGIKNLANLRIQFDCDILYQNVNPLIVKKIIRNTLSSLGSIYWPILAGHTVLPVQIAEMYKIPLIFWGSNQGIEQVGMFSYTHEVEMSKRYRIDHDLMGVDEKTIINNFNTLNSEDLKNYVYPSHSSILKNNIVGIYLGNFIRWDQKAQHELMIKRYNYRTSKLNRTFDAYDYVDCHNYMNLHDLLKLYKHGFSKVTDHACREIRFGRISRDYAIKLIKKYEKQKPKYIDLFCQWLDIDDNSLRFILDQHRNSNFWEKSKDNKWKFKALSTYHKSNLKKINSNDKNFEKSYIINDNISLYKKKYITFGKGYP